MQIINIKSRMSSYTTVASIARRQRLKVLTQEPFWPRLKKKMLVDDVSLGQAVSKHTHIHTGNEQNRKH